MEQRNWDVLEKFVMNLTKQEIAEISEHYRENWDFTVNSPEEILDFLKEADYDWDYAQDQGYTPEEYIFWWREFEKVTTKSSINMEAYYKQTTVQKVNQGTLFKLTNSETAPWWIRGEYIREARKYSCYKYEDVNHEKLMKGSHKIFI